MAALGFLNRNSNIAYPLVSRPAPEITTHILADCGFVLQNENVFDPAVDDVQLGTIEKTLTLLRYTFYSTAGGYSSFIFDFPLAGLQRYASISRSLSTAGCVKPLWSGYVTIGQPEKILAMFALDPAIKTLNIPVEKSCVTVSSYRRVTTVMTGNTDRERYTSPVGCLPACGDPAMDLHVNETCLQKPIRFVEGYNCQISQIARNNSLVFSAVVGGGAGDPCNEAPIYPAEEPPPGATFLSGAPGCNEVVRRIAGVGGRNLELISGAGVTLTTDALNNKIVVDYDTHDLVICVDSADGPFAPLPEAPEPECPCGPGV